MTGMRFTHRTTEIEGNTWIYMFDRTADDMFKFTYTNPHAPEYRLSYMLEEMPGGLVKLCPQEGWFHELVNDGFLNLPDAAEVSRILGYEVKLAEKQEWPDHPEECRWFEKVVACA